MRPLVLALTVVLFMSNNLLAQQALPKLSPLTQLYLSDVEQIKTDYPIKEYVHKRGANGTLYLSGMIEVNKDVQQKDFDKLGVNIGTKAGDIWTVAIPTGSINQFSKLSGINYIALDQPIAPLMNKANQVTRVDSVHGGYAPLTTPYTGKDVVVGIIDAGYDYNHPTLRDTSDNQSRVKRVWEQKVVGTPPSGYNYGSELTSDANIKAKGTDLAQFSHGAHVAGIAAGSGIGSTNNTKFRGVAFSSDLVLVGITPDSTQWLHTGMSDVIDGMNYIYNYAASVGKPAVANLSWGCSVGPHDGNSLFSKACDALTGQGKIFVCSGGNNGTNYIHLDKRFTTTDTIVNTELQLGAPLKHTWVDIWGDTAKKFCISVTLYNGSTAGATTGFVCLDNSLHRDTLVGTDGDTCFVDIVTDSSSFNGKPRTFLRFHHKSNNTIYLSAKGTDGNINMWTGYVQKTVGYYGRFLSSGNIPNTTGGNTNMTLGDIASTRSAIAVASFASNIRFTNLASGTIDYSSYVLEGRRAPYSSLGPSSDGRVKPDISAPGLMIGSGVSTFDTAYLPSGSSASSLVEMYKSPIDNKDYYYAMLTGTSMSGPVVAGIVALMLEANPKLTPEKVLSILQETAIQDIHTGSINLMNKNAWGYGKVNAFASVKRAVESLGISSTAGISDMDCRLYPNPNGGQFNIYYNTTKAETLTIEIIDLTGKKVFVKEWNVATGSNTKELNIAHLQKGLYFTRVSSATQGNITFKTIVK